MCRKNAFTKGKRVTAHQEKMSVIFFKFVVCNLSESVLVLTILVNFHLIVTSLAFFSLENYYLEVPVI